MEGEADKKDVQAFWKAPCHSLHDGSDDGLTRDGLMDALAETEDMFRLREHMAVVEMPPGEIAGKAVLEIGPGAGGHSALFARHGARMTSIDLTNERACATQAKFHFMGDAARDCRALQGDEENLPFADGDFDIVYSNGVLHHIPRY